MLEGSILQKLRDAHQSGQGGKQSLNFGVYYKNSLVALCHALEDAILTNDYSPLMIAAFQRGKWYLQEADRYAAIADCSQQIVIMAAPESGFAEHATSQKPNVALVSLDPTDPVAQEWHLIILSPTYTAMVLCQELSEADYQAAGMPQADRERKFYGFWTFEPSLVLEAAELAIAHVGHYQPELQQALTAQIDAIRSQLHQHEVSGTSLTVDHLGQVVTRVVDYLQATQDDLSAAMPDYVAHAQQLDNNLISNELQAFLRVAQLIDQTDLSNPMAAAEVASLAEAIGQLLDLPAWQLHRLRLAGLLHRIAFLQHAESSLSPGSTTRYQDESPSVPLTCPLVPGTQVLRRMPRLRAIATILNHQTEWWNGSGQPAGLAGDEIPLESRILGLMAHFQAQLTVLNNSPTAATDDLLSKALAVCQAQQGDRWDPKLVETLSLLVIGLQQGIELPITPPKIASGLWLLNSYGNEELVMVSSDNPTYTD